MIAERLFRWFALPCLVYALATTAELVDVLSQN